MEVSDWEANWAKEAIDFPQACTIIEQLTQMYFAS